MSDSTTLTGPGHTPNASLEPFDRFAPRRKMVIEIEVAADFERRMDNQWMVEREIHADRWSWKWAGPAEQKTVTHDIEGVVDQYMREYDKLQAEAIKPSTATSSGQSMFSFIKNL